MAGAIEHSSSLKIAPLPAPVDEPAFLRATNVDHRDLTRSLAVFDEVWDCLLPREQERVLGLSAFAR